MIGLSADGIKALGAGEDWKQNFGEKIYVRVQAKGYSDPDMAGKITGVLIDQEPEQLAQMVVSEDALNSKIKEAQELIESAADKQ